MNTIAPKTENTDPNPHVVKLGEETKKALEDIAKAPMAKRLFEMALVIVLVFGAPSIIILLAGVFLMNFIPASSASWFCPSIVIAFIIVIISFYFARVTAPDHITALRILADARGTHLRMLMASIADYQSELFVHGPNEERRERLQAFADMLEDDFTRNGPIGSPGTDVPVHLPDDIVAVIDSFASRALDRRLRTKAMIEVNQVGSESKKRS